MRRERALKIVLVVVGLIFFGLVYPLTIFVRQEPALAIMRVTPAGHHGSEAVAEFDRVIDQP